MAVSESAARKLSRDKQLADIKIPGRDDAVMQYFEGAGLSSPVGTIIRQRQAQSPAGSATHSLARNAQLTAILEMCIYLPDLKGITFSVEGGRLATVAYISRLVAGHLGLNAEIADETFALWFMSPILEVQLKSTHVPFHVRREWPALCRKYTCASEFDIASDEPLLVYRRNFRLTKEKQKTLSHNDKLCVGLLYSDAREANLSGFMPTSLETAVQLAAIDLCIHSGPFKEGQHTQEDVESTLQSLLPQCHLPEPLNFTTNPCSFFLKCTKSGRSKDAPGANEICALAGAILKQYKTLSEESLSSFQLQLKYLAIVMKLPYYGAAYFTGQVERCPKEGRRRKSTETSDSEGIELQNMSVNGQPCEKSRQDNHSENFVKRWLHLSHAGAYTIADTQPLEEDLPIKVAVSSSHVTLLRNIGSMAAAGHGDGTSSGVAAKPEVLMCRELALCDWTACPLPEDPDSMPSMFLLVPSTDYPTTMSSVRSEQDVECDNSYLVQVFTKQAIMVVAAMDSCLTMLEHQMQFEPDETANGDATDSDMKPDVPQSDLVLLSDKMGKLCAAKIDPDGNCISARGTMKSILIQDVTAGSDAIV